MAKTIKNQIAGKLEDAIAEDLKAKLSSENDKSKEYANLSEEELQNIVHRLGSQISEDYKGKNLVLVSVLKGSVVFMADLMRAITIPCAIDFMAVSSYGKESETSGVVTLKKDVDASLEGKSVIIVEDIIDTGRTLNDVVKILKERNPHSLRVITLLDKPDRRLVDFTRNGHCTANISHKHESAF